MKTSAVLPIALYPWGGEYRPEAWAQASMDEENLYFKLWCREDNRDKPHYHHDNDPVCEDSCLEAFVLCYPDSPIYLNFEVNRAGAMMLQAGTERADRYCPSPDAMAGVPFPKARAFELDDGWGMEVKVPIAFIHAIYGTGAPLDTAAMRGNFYKCGSVPDREHYACWAPVSAPAPDYHRPEAFSVFW